MKNDHPSVVRFKAASPAVQAGLISATELRKLALECGADDAGAVRLDRPELDSERPYVKRAMGTAQAVLSIVKKMAPAPIQSVARSLANQEFHAATDEVGEIGRKIVSRLDRLGIRGLNTSAGFPMEMHEFPGRTWVVSHKVIAEAAGLGKMGIHRNVIHPKFGSFVLLNSILLDCELEDESAPLDYNPCLECKLCVSACPVGAIAPDGHFDSVACLNHNYREFMGGFIDWVDTIADSQGRSEYQSKVSDQETASWWQSLSTGPNYKSAYCMAVCPAGDDIIGRFLGDKRGFIEGTLNPLQEKVEPVYVVPGSDAEAHVLKRFPHKTVRRIGSGVRPTSVAQLLQAMPLAFQRGRAKGIDVRYHFSFTGKEAMDVTIGIADQRLLIETGHVGKAKLRVKVDSVAWIDFLAKRTTLGKMILRRKLQFWGDLRVLAQFGRCFPS
jgi:ferredoxin